MAKRPLKVFRTAIGFHDAYVAATSRKAALEAWGRTRICSQAGRRKSSRTLETARRPWRSPVSSSVFRAGRSPNTLQQRGTVPHHPYRKKAPSGKTARHPPLRGRRVASRAELAWTEQRQPCRGRAKNLRGGSKKSNAKSRCCAVSVRLFETAWKKRCKRWSNVGATKNGPTKMPLWHGRCSAV